VIKANSTVGQTTLARAERTCCSLNTLQEQMIINLSPLTRVSSALTSVSSALTQVSSHGCNEEKQNEASAPSRHKRYELRRGHDSALCSPRPGGRDIPYVCLDGSGAGTLPSETVGLAAPVSRAFLAIQSRAARVLSVDKRGSSAPASWALPV
jgi:hypothetical protein